ncbi:hypothetical protein V3481_007398 [Fusarium oxysporum f. sp. vasinfectum]
MNNLGFILSSVGKYEEAERMHRETLQLREKVLGKEHPETLANMNNLANVLDRMGKYDAKQKVRLPLELNKDSISKAVDTYISYKVDRLACHKKYDKETRDAVENYLTSNADGTFLWVALVCQELADPKVRKRHTLNTLKSFPPGLDSLYDRMIAHIGDSKDAGLCKEVLAIASVVYRPITLEELQVFVKSLEEDNYNDLPQISSRAWNKTGMHACRRFRAIIIR